MQTTVRCCGHLEQRSIPNTTWEDTTGIFEPSPSILEWVLPANGLYTGARYYITLTLSDTPLEADRHIGAYTSQIVGTGSFSGEYLRVTVPPGAETESAGIAGMFGTLCRAVDWEAYAGGECWVRMSFEYDPGLSRLRNEISQAQLVELEQANEYATDAYTFPWDPAELPVSDPTTAATDLEWAVPQLGLILDHTGCIRTADSELQLPVGIRHGIVHDGTLVLLVDPDRGGVSDPTVELPATQTIIGVDANCSLKWTIDTNGFDPSGLVRGPVLKDDTVFVTSSLDQTMFVVDTDTGRLTDAISMFE